MRLPFNFIGTYDFVEMILFRRLVLAVGMSADHLIQGLVFNRNRQVDPFSTGNRPNAVICLGVNFILIGIKRRGNHENQ
jgi:hypothetical protein